MWGEARGGAGALAASSSPLRRLRHVVDANGAGYAVRRLALLAYTRLYAAAKGAKVGAGCVIHPGARLEIDGGGVAMGAGCEVHRGALLATYGGEIRLGERVSVNPYSILYGHGGLTIGDEVRIAAHVVIVPANHGLAPDRPIRAQPLSLEGIRIGDDVWIGAGVRILDGVQVAQGCVIAAGAVVTKSLTEPGAVYGGVPARRIGSRFDRKLAL